MFETTRAQSELFAFQCSQWELIWNSQLIGRYKEMSPGESYDIHPPPHYNTARTITVNISQIIALPGNTADCPPHYNTATTTTVYISQISALPGNTADIYTDTKNRYEEKSVLPGYLHLVV